MNSRQNEKNREALIAVLTVCLIGVLVTVVIIAAVDLYRKHTYTAEIDPSEYKIIKIEKSTTTSYSAATETVDTDSIYVVTVEYQVDGVIDCSLMFCCLYDTEKLAVSEALKAKNIPVLSLETDYTDKDAEQLRTRIGAFVEMLNQ